jgi:hypothetical protein
VLEGAKCRQIPGSIPEKKKVFRAKKNDRRRITGRDSPKSSTSPTAEKVESTGTPAVVSIFHLSRSAFTSPGQPNRVRFRGPAKKSFPVALLFIRPSERPSPHTPRRVPPPWRLCSGHRPSPGVARHSPLPALIAALR